MARNSQARKGKLSRAEIQEILERNAELYRNDVNFAKYIVELALYMLEHEYDWTESSAEPPRGANDTKAGLAEPPPRPAPPLPPTPIAPAARLTGGREAPEAARGRNRTRMGDEGRETKIRAKRPDAPPLRHVAVSPPPPDAVPPPRARKEPEPPPPSPSAPVAREPEESSKLVRLEMLADRVRHPLPQGAAPSGSGVKALLNSIKPGASPAPPPNPAGATSSPSPGMTSRARPKTTFRACPHCGNPIGDELLCPSCRNMTR